jgi:hypothetical protein
VRSFTEITRPGEWPSHLGDLPLVFTQQQLAHLRNVTTRTLQRERRLNVSIPYVRDGKRVLYPRHHVLEHFGLAGPRERWREVAPERQLDRGGDIGVGVAGRQRDEGAP